MIDKTTNYATTDNFYFSIKKFKRLPAKHENLSVTAEAAKKRSAASLPPEIKQAQKEIKELIEEDQRFIYQMCKEIVKRNSPNKTPELIMNYDEQQQEQSDYISRPSTIQNQVKKNKQIFNSSLQNQRYDKKIFKSNLQARPQTQMKSFSRSRISTPSTDNLITRPQTQMTSRKTNTPSVDQFQKTSSTIEPLQKTDSSLFALQEIQHFESNLLERQQTIVTVSQFEQEQSIKLNSENLKCYLFQSKEGIVKRHSELKQCSNVLEYLNSIKFVINAQILDHKLNPVQLWNAKQLTLFQLFDLLYGNLIEIDDKSFEVTYLCTKSHGLFALEFKDFIEAAKVFKRIKKYCQKHKRLREKMYVYKQLGYIYQILRFNEKALKCYKQMMYLAWYHDNFIIEMEAYQGIAMNQFYLGSIKKAKLYHDRAFRGKSESEFSIVRQTAIQVIVASRDRQFEVLSSKKYSKGFERIPSLSGFAIGYETTQSQSQKPIFEDYIEKKKFTMPELLYLNKVPKISEKEKGSQRALDHSIQIKRKPKPSQSSLRNTYFQKKRDPNAGEPFSVDDFRKIVSLAASKQNYKQENKPIRVTHLSQTRTQPLDNFSRIKIGSVLTQIIQNLEEKISPKLI